MNPFALFDAAFADDGKLIAKEIAAGANPNLVHPDGGHTALSVASEMGALEAVVALISAGADPRQRFNWKSQVSGRASSDRTALMSASTRAVVAELVKAGADMEAADEQGWTALVHAIDMINFEVVEELLNCGASTVPRLRGPNSAQSLEQFISEKLAHLKEISGVDPSPQAKKILDEFERIRVRLMR